MSKLKWRIQSQILGTKKQIRPLGKKLLNAQDNLTWLSAKWERKVVLFTSRTWGRLNFMLSPPPFIRMTQPYHLTLSFCVLSFDWKINSRDLLDNTCMIFLKFSREKKYLFNHSFVYLVLFVDQSSETTVSLSVFLVWNLGLGSFTILYLKMGIFFSFFLLNLELKWDS